jgi:hypothetical protein
VNSGSLKIKGNNFDNEGSMINRIYIYMGRYNQENYTKYIYYIKDVLVLYQIHLTTSNVTA